MRNWQSTLGGSVAALGIFLFGGPIALSVCGVDIPKNVMQAFVVTGFVLQGVGVFFAHLFGADAKAVKELTAKVDETAKAVTTGDTTMLEKRAVADAAAKEPEKKG